MAQHDYSIANQSGASFRSDLNNALAAIVSQNSGPTEPSTTFAYQPWADTTAGLFKIRNAANNAWVTWGALADVGLGLLSRGGGTMTGPLLAAAGTAAAPGIGIAGDSNTGFYGRAANELGAAIAGALVAWFDSSGVNIAAQDDLRLWDADTSHYVGFQAPATVAANRVWTLPAADGAADQVLGTDGSGGLSFVTRGRVELATAVATTSGTAIDFTSIPNWVKKIIVMLNGVSTNGTSPVLIRLGTASGFEATGYNTFSSSIVGSTAAYAANTDGINTGFNSASANRAGAITITSFGSNAWSYTGLVGDGATGGVVHSTGIKGLSGPLTQLRLTAANGTDVFDNGSANLLLEG